MRPSLRVEEQHDSVRRQMMAQDLKPEWGCTRRDRIEVRVVVGSVIVTVSSTVAETLISQSIKGNVLWGAILLWHGGEVDVLIFLSYLCNLFYFLIHSFSTNDSISYLDKYNIV